MQISGVTGDVTDIGWLQLRLKEIDIRTQQPTGNVIAVLVETRIANQFGPFRNPCF